VVLNTVVRANAVWLPREQFLDRNLLLSFGTSYVAMVVSEITSRSSAEYSGSVCTRSDKSLDWYNSNLCRREFFHIHTSGSVCLVKNFAGRFAGRGWLAAF
jgi:hypothetical protein